MGDILLVASSAMGALSASRRIGTSLAEAARQENPAIGVTVRDLNGIAHVSFDGLRAFGLPPAERTDEQAAIVAFADCLMEEVERASIIVIAAPMYCLTIPSTLKAWIEHLNRPGKAFKRGPEGETGLLTGRTVYVVITRSHRFAADDAMNFQESYLKAMLGFFGMTDVRFILVEGTSEETGKAEIAAAEVRAAEIGQAIGRDWSR